MKISSAYLITIFKNLNIKNVDLFLKKILTKKQYDFFKIRYDDNFNEIKSISEITEEKRITRQGVYSIYKSIYKRILNEYFKHNNQQIPSRKDQLIESIKELGRLPYDYTKDKKPERVFIPDGTNQRAYYNNLKKKYFDIKEKEKKNITLTDKDFEIIKEFEEIQGIAQEEENTITLSNYAKELIETIHILHRLPKQDRTKQTSEMRFSDGKDQRTYYDMLKSKVIVIMKHSDKESLSKQERQYLFDYQEIIKVLKQYKQISDRNLTDDQRKDEIIELIKTKHRKPQKGKNMDKFSNGSVQIFYYTNLITRVKNLQEESKTRNLTTEEKKLISNLEEIEKAIKEYCDYDPLENKIKELIVIINTLQRLPKAKRENNGIIEIPFSDGTDPRNLYDRINIINNKAKAKEAQGIALSSRETFAKKAFIKLKNITSFYPAVKKDNKKNIEILCEKAGINLMSNKELYKKSCGELYAKLMFLYDNNYSIKDDFGRLHEIFFMSEINMYEKYNITLNDLLNTYINGKSSFEQFIKRR